MKYERSQGIHDRGNRNSWSVMGGTETACVITMIRCRRRRDRQTVLRLETAFAARWNWKATVSHTKPRPHTTRVGFVNRPGPRKANFRLYFQNAETKFILIIRTVNGRRFGDEKVLPKRSRVSITFIHGIKRRN